MKQIKLLLTLLISLMMGTNARAAVDETFTANTVEGVAVTYKVLTEDGTTGTVQVGNDAVAISTDATGPVTIPAEVTNGSITYSVTRIGEYAFKNCSSITNIIVPSSVTRIETQAIYGCSALERVTMLSPNPPYIYNTSTFYSFKSNKKECLLIVPEGSRSAYSSWAVNFFNIKEVGHENILEVGDVAIHPLVATNINTGEAIENCYYAYVTYIDVTPKQRKAIIYRPLSLYDPECDFDSNPCWDDQNRNDNIAMFNAVTSNYTACSLSIPSSVTDSEGNEYTVVGIGANAAYSGSFSGVQEIRIPKKVTHIGRKAFYGLGKLTGKVVFPSSVRQIGAPGKTSFASLFNNYMTGSNYIGWVKGLYIMHSNADDFHWYDGTYTGPISNGAGYFYYNNYASQYKSTLYVSQDIRDTYEGTSGNGIYAWSNGNASQHHNTYTLDPALVAGITSDYVEQYSTGTYQLYIQNKLDLPITADNFTSSDPSKVRIVSLTESVAGNGYNYLTYEVLDRGSVTISFNYPGDDVLDPLSSSVTITYPDDIFTETVDGNELTFRVLTEGNEGNTVQLGAARYDYITLDDDDAPIFFDEYGEYEQFAVPETVEHDGKTYTVTAIGAYAFANFPGESVELPATIETIGFRAFYYSDNNPYNVSNLYVNSQVPPTLIIDNNNYYKPFNSQFSYNCTLHVPEGYKAAYDNSDWSGKFKRIIEPVDAIVIKGVVYTSENTDLFGDGKASLTWEPEESAGGSIPVANAPRKAGEKSGTENLVPVLTLNNATINYTGNGPAIEVNSYPCFYIRLRGQNTITATNANAAISVGTAKGGDFDEVSLIILNDDEQEINYPEPANAPRKANGSGSNVLASLTVNNTTTGGNGIYINCGSFNVQNCAVDATGTSYGLRYNESSGGGMEWAPRHQAEENGGPRKVVAPDGPVNPEYNAGYLNVYEGSELTLHGDVAAVWGAGNRYFENVGVVESDLNVYMSQYKYYEMPGFRGYNPYYEGNRNYETYEIWVSNDNENWQPKYAKSLTIAPNTLYADTYEGVQMKFTIVSESAKTIRVGDEEGRQAIAYYYNGSITIPETVEGYDVVGIAASAFADCSLTSIVLPETEAFSWIGNSAFESCSLQEIYIPGNVTKIGRAAFEGSSLYAVYFDAATGLKSLPDALFYNCNYLEWVQLPSSVSSIGYNAFTDCSNTLQIACFAVVPPSLDDYIGSGTTLWVPYGCYNKYKNSDWNQYFDEIDLIPAEYNNIVTIEPEDEYVVNIVDDLIMDDEALPLENAVAGGVYYNLVSNGDEFNGIDVSEGCIVISSTTSEEDMATVVDSELQSETMQNNFCGLIVEVNGKGTLKINCMTVGSGVLTVRIGNGAPIPYTSDGKTPIAIPFDVTEPTLIYIYASDSEAGSGVKGYRLMGRRRAGDSNEISGVMIYQMSVEEHVPVYNIEIAGKMVTGENASNFTCNDLAEGTISFDPQTYTLTLNNVVLFAAIKMNGFAADENVQHLTINLVGNNVILSYENPFYVWQSDDENLNPLPPFVELTFTSANGGSLTSYTEDDGWVVGGTWVLDGVRDLTIDHCRVIGGMIDAEAITVQNGAILATSYQIEGSVTCGEGISYRGFTNGLYIYGPNGILITEPVNISQYGLATFCSPNNDLDFTEVEGVKAYIATGFNSATNQLTLTRVYNVPAGTGLLLWSVSGEAVENMQIPVEATTNTYENNMFVGCVEDTYIQPTVGEYTNFVLSKHSGDDFLGFYTFTTSNENGRLIEAGKAYLRIPTDQLNNGGDIKGFSLVFDDDPTAIGVIENGQFINDDAIYNVAGQRLNKVQKGINIMSDKKVLIK